MHVRHHLWALPMLRARVHIGTGCFSNTQKYLCNRRFFLQPNFNHLALSDGEPYPFLETQRVLQWRRFWCGVNDRITTLHNFHHSLKILIGLTSLHLRIRNAFFEIPTAIMAQSAIHSPGELCQLAALLLDCRCPSL